MDIHKTYNLRLDEYSLGCILFMEGEVGCGVAGDFSKFSLEIKKISE